MQVNLLYNEEYDKYMQSDYCRTSILNKEIYELDRLRLLSISCIMININEVKL